MPFPNQYLRHHVNIRHLRVMVALDDHRNVGRVAAYLNVTQPAVSKTLAKLESGLGVQLFVRGRRGMEPTDAGTCLVRHAREILSRLSEAGSELRDIAEGQLGHVSLGVLPSSAVVLVPRFIARRQPNDVSVSISVTEGTMATLLPALRAGDIDMTVGVLPTPPLGPEFGTEVLMEDPIAVVVRRNHPLTRLAHVSWNHLDGYPMVLPPQTAYTRGAIDAILARHELSASLRIVESVSTMTNVGTLQLTDSVGFLSNMLARHFQNLGVLTVLSLEAPDGVTMRVGLIWMIDRHFTEAHRLVRSGLLETSRELLNGALPPVAKPTDLAPSRNNRAG